jgi:choline dehydrogenase-like flavoprotein
VVSVTGTLPGLDAGFEPPMLGAAHVEAEGYMLTDLCRPQWLHNTLAVAAGRPDRALGFRSQASVMVKARDGLSGAMSRFGSPGKPLTASDREILQRGEDDARAILTRAGAVSIYRTSHVAVHPGGTAKVGDVVDTNLQTEIAGLFVCDASVIPIPWGLPPTFTVMSLGRRLARHLSGSVLASPHAG